MQYFLTMPHDSATEPTMASMKDLDPEELEALLGAVGELNSALEKAGALLFAGGLQPPSTAKTVDATTEPTQVVYAPFVEASAYVGGFWVIEADDEAAAVRWATMASRATQSRIEVRALQEVPS
ncbi:YciI family protein [Leifsonia sp. NPDC058230]|uniref:YciI family protein n=1 Tax=Leifsonia sp. NPDC058230 TaxID=3346391 RepID=UPI0036D9C6C9